MLCFEVSWRGANWWLYPIFLHCGLPAVPVLHQRKVEDVYQMSGKAALVTGAGAGIGGSSALTFAREGARVVVADISPEGGREPVEVVREAGGEAIFVHVDVAQAGQVQAMIQTPVTHS